MRRSQTVWFLVLPHSGLLDLAGPWEVLGHANDVLGFPAYQLRMVGPCGPVTPTGHGICVSNVQPLNHRSSRLPDVFVVAGASSLVPVPEAQVKAAKWLRQHHPRIATIVSICAGAFLLGEAGLLDGRRATTHWMRQKELQSRFPKSQIVDEGIFVQDRRVWTSAGLTAGIDLTLALVEAHHGHRLAMDVAKRMVLFLRRSGNQAQFSSALQRQEREPAKSRDIAAFVLEHLDEALSVERVASGVGMSQRSLSRWCREHLDESPAELVRRVRMEEARRLLEQTPLALKEVAARAGLGDTSTLFRLFIQQLGVSPADYRRRFGVSVRDIELNVAATPN